MDSNSSITLTEFARAVSTFSEERDWSQFHTMKNLSMALSVEVSELVELFQWSTDQEQFNDLQSEKKAAVRDEIGDIFIYLLRFCEVTGIDLLEAADQKLNRNAIKYPVERVKGLSKKYDEYGEYRDSNE